MPYFLAPFYSIMLVAATTSYLQMDEKSQLSLKGCIIGQVCSGIKINQKLFFKESCFSKSTKLPLSTCDRLCSAHLFLHFHVVRIDYVCLQNYQQAGTFE